MLHSGTIQEDLLIAYGAVYEKFRKGSVVFQEGSICRFYHQLISGSVRWINLQEDGREYIQAFIEPGECFGELPLFDGEPYAATAITNTDCVVLRLNKPTFLKLLVEHPEEHLHMTTLIAARLRTKFFFSRSAVQLPPEKKIGDLMEWLKNHNRLHHADTGFVNLTRQQIADLCGLRVETVIRTIRRMHDAGTLRLDGRKIYYS